MFGWVGGVFSKSVLGFEEVVLRMGRRLLMEEEEKFPKKPLSPLLLFCFMVLAIEGRERERREFGFKCWMEREDEEEECLLLLYCWLN